GGVRNGGGRQSDGSRVRDVRRSRVRHASRGYRRERAASSGAATGTGKRPRYPLTLDIVCQLGGESLCAVAGRNAGAGGRNCHSNVLRHDARGRLEGSQGSTPVV